MNKTADGEYFLECPSCFEINDVSKTVYRINKIKDREFYGQSCCKCRNMITVVITMFGVRCLESLAREKYNKNET